MYECTLASAGLKAGALYCMSWRTQAQIGEGASTLRGQPSSVAAIVEAFAHRRQPRWRALSHRSDHVPCRRIHRALLGLPKVIRQEDGTRDDFEAVFQRLDADDSKSITLDEFMGVFGHSPGRRSPPQQQPTLSSVTITLCAFVEVCSTPFAPNEQLSTDVNGDDGRASRAARIHVQRIGCAFGQDIARHALSLEQASHALEELTNGRDAIAALRRVTNTRNATLLYASDLEAWLQHRPPQPQSSRRCSACNLERRILCPLEWRECPARALIWKVHKARVCSQAHRSLARRFRAQVRPIWTRA